MKTKQITNKFTVRLRVSFVLSDELCRYATGSKTM